MLCGSLLEIGYLVLRPNLEAAAGRLRSALVAVPTRLLRSPRPSGTRGMYPPLGHHPISHAQTPCRMVAAISTTVQIKVVSIKFGHVLKNEAYMVDVEDVLVTR